MGVTEDFVAKFHNLDGITIAQRRKSFNSLLQNSRDLLSDEKQSRAILSRITPQNHLEDIFRTEFLIHCQLIPEMLNLLTSGNEMHIKKIIKNDWFFQKAFADIEANKIVEEMLPSLSYSTRMKVLHKFVLYIKNEKKIHEIFNLVKHKYGLQTALPLLLGCSEEGVKVIIQNDPVFLTHHQLKDLIRKYPKVLPVYVEEHLKHKNNSDFLHNDDIARLIESKDIEVFNFLKEKHHMSVQYGRRSTKKLFDQQKDEILENPKLYEHCFEKSTFTRRLVGNGAFKRYFLTAFPKSVCEFSYYSVSDLLLKAPKKKRFDLLQECFEEVYKVPLLESLDQIDKNILEMIPDTNRREEIAKKKMEKTDDIEYLIFQTTFKSIPFFKNQMNVSSDMSQRKKLIKLLVKTCQKNDDLAALLEVCKYVSVRHRNDVQVLSTFFHCLQEFFDLHRFTKEIWDVVNELVRVYKMKNEYMYGMYPFLVVYLEFTYNAGEPTESLLLDLILEDCGIDPLLYHKCKNDKFIKDMIEDSIELFSKKQKAGSSDNIYVTLISDIEEWVRKHPKYSIDYVSKPVLMAALKTALEDTEEVIYFRKIGFLFSKKYENEIIDELFDLYIKNHFNNSPVEFHDYCLKWYPQKLNKFCESFVAAVDCEYLNISRSEKLLRNVKKYDYLGLRQNVISIIQNKFNEDCDRSERLSNQFKTSALSILMYPEDYLNYVDKYKPKSLSVDAKNDKESEIYQLQTTIVRNLRNIQSPVVLPAIMSYCGGDFLRHLLCPLYKSFYHTPENLLYPYVDQIAKQSVAIRKHAVFLTCRIFGLDRIKKVLTSVSKEEKNMSLQKQYTLTTFKYFCKNPIQEFWELFVSNLKYIDDKDNSSFETLVSQRYIPLDYISMYYQEIWNLIESKQLTESFRSTIRTSFLEKVLPYTERLSFRLCTDIIEKLFLKGICEESIYSFICDYLLKHKESRRFDKIIEFCLDAKKKSSGNCDEKETINSNICCFINRFCDFYLTKNDSKMWDKSLLEKFCVALSELYPDVQFFNQYALLLLILVLIRSSDLTIEGFALKVCSYSNEMVEKYGQHILDRLAKVIITSLDYFCIGFVDKRIKLNFANALMMLESSLLTQYISLKIILVYDSEDDGYNEVLKSLKTSTYPFIQIELHDNGLFDE